MTVPARPTFQQQGPGSNCMIGGRQYGWLSCTSYSTAMAIDKATLGAKAPSGCTIRKMTADVVGGTTLPQNAAVARLLGVPVQVHSGSSVGSPAELAGVLHLGRGCVVQGGTKPVLKTPFRSTAGPINHAIYVNEVRGGTVFSPAEALVYDPAADGRRKGIDQGPSWWPWSLLVAFAAALQPWGEGDPRTVGKGRVYFAAFPDTEPHVHLKFGGKRTTPFPDRTRADAPVVWMHSEPKPHARYHVGAPLKAGDLFEAWQVTKTGEAFQGSRVWYGNHDGDRWVHSKHLRREGGNT